MNHPTKNKITQEAHGKRNAVDYDSTPDPLVYAPEDLEFVSFGPAGDLGQLLICKGASGIHRFAHLREAYIKEGERVFAGAKIARMGNTGKVQKIMGDGTHLHYEFQNNDGEWIYPPLALSGGVVTSPAPPPSTNKKEQEVYVVVKNDSLSKIAARYGRAWPALYKLNRDVIGPNPNLIFPGQRIRIPDGWKRIK